MLVAQKDKEREAKGKERERADLRRKEQEQLQRKREQERRATEAEAAEAAEAIAAQGLSVRQTEALVKRLTTEKKEREPSSNPATWVFQYACSSPSVCWRVSI